MNVIRENFRANLVALLDEMGRGSRVRLAEHLDATPALVTQLCSGKANPTIQRIEQIAEFFGVTDVEMVSPIDEAE